MQLMRRAAEKKCTKEMTSIASLQKRSVSGPLSQKSALMIDVQHQASFALLKWHFSAGYHHNSG